MKPQVHKSKIDSQKSAATRGFTLLELIVVSAIIALASAWSIPEFKRGIAQAQVDRYAANIERGLFSIKATLKRLKESCEIDFSNVPAFQPGEYKDASVMLEQTTQPSSNQLTRKQTDPLYRCNYTTNDVSDLINDSTEVSSQNIALKRIQQLAASVRLVGQLNTKEKNKVKIASTKATYLFTPALGSSEVLTLLVKSKEADQPWALKSDGSSRLVTRCIQSGFTVKYGTWTGSKCIEK